MNDLKVQGIYMIFNILNNKCYVGSSKFIKGRKEQHIRELRKNKHGNSHLQHAWNKYGENSFIFIKLEEVSETDNLCEREVFWILQKDSLNPNFGYNLGIPKQSDNCSLREETITKLLISTYNQYHLNNSAITLEEFLNGKRAKDLKERFGPQNKKKVLCFNSKTGIKELEFESITETAKYFETSENYISRILDIDNKTCKNYIFITESNFDNNKTYKKVYKTQEPKGFREPFKGNPVETFNLDTLETVAVYDNLFDAAEKLLTSRKVLQKVIYKERKSFKGMGVRLIKNIQVN